MVDAAVDLVREVDSDLSGVGLVDEIDRGGWFDGRLRSGGLVCRRHWWW
jgi:hypothetical protein